ncbi:MAG: hypothetical protein IPJ34_38145 [Myxococcales bacterium]|nr:hypothetical protein [Myxococcales bacterium]
MSRGGPLLLGLVVGCGARSGLLVPDPFVDGSDASTDGAIDGTTDAADTADVAPDTTIDALADAPVDGDAAVVGDAETDAEPPCAPPTVTTIDLYVDRAYAGTIHNGSAACPWSRITDALAFVGIPSSRRVVHVRGGTSTTPLRYDEPGALSIHKNVTVRGDGPIVTHLPVELGALVLHHGAILEGFTIVGDDGVITEGGAPPADVDAATLRHATVTGAGGTGTGSPCISAHGSVHLGPDLVVTGCKNHGVFATAGDIHVVGTTCSFSGNKPTGITVGIFGRLLFEGGTASGNSEAGVRLGARSVSSLKAPHLVYGLVARDNGIAGLDVWTDVPVHVGASTLLHNRFGVRTTADSGAVLDLGGDLAGAGKNNLGSATLGDRNTHAGVCIDAAHPASIRADDNAWSSCAPSFVQKLVPSCETGSGYADVWYRPASSTATGVPLVASTCTVGP